MLSALPVYSNSQPVDQITQPLQWATDTFAMSELCPPEDDYIRWNYQTEHLVQTRKAKHINDNNTLTIEQSITDNSRFGLQINHQNALWRYKLGDQFLKSDTSNSTVTGSWKGEWHNQMLSGQIGPELLNISTHISTNTELGYYHSRKHYDFNYQDDFGRTATLSSSVQGIYSRWNNCHQRLDILVGDRDFNISAWLTNRSERPVFQIKLSHHPIQLKEDNKLTHTEGYLTMWSASFEILPLLSNGSIGLHANAIQLDQSGQVWSGDEITGNNYITEVQQVNGNISALSQGIHANWHGFNEPWNTTFILGARIDYWQINGELQAWQPLFEGSIVTLTTLDQQPTQESALTTTLTMTISKRWHDLELQLSTSQLIGLDSQKADNSNNYRAAHYNLRMPVKPTTPPSTKHLHKGLGGNLSAITIQYHF